VKIPSLASIFLIFIVLFGYTATSRADVPHVVSSIKPVHSLTAAVMQGAGEPELLVNGAGTPHTYSLRPSEVRSLSRADVVFWIGPDFEIFLQKPLRALAADALSIALMDQPPVTVLSNRRNGLLSASSQNSEGDKADAHTRDGHIWLDPMNAIAMVRVIAQSLQQADAGNAKLYADNAAATISALEKLNSDLIGQLAPFQEAPFVVFHDAFQYFENRYGLNAIGFVVDTPEQISSAKSVAMLRAAIALRRPACIFAEPSAEPDLARMLMEGTDLRLGSLDPEGSELSSGTDFYYNLMRKLAYDFSSCLSGTMVNGR
jgi:zinc transport system substrate-binding protein